MAERQEVTLGMEIVRLLAARGIDTVFGIPGTHNLELYRGLDAHPEVRHILVRHEQGAGYAADGYFRATGRPAAVFVTSGPALANVLAAAGTAYADRIPLLVISPGPEPDRALRQDGWLHLTKDQHGMAAAVFGESVRAESTQGALETLDLFLLGWQTGRNRLPMHLEVPASMLEASADAAFVASLPWHASMTAPVAGVLSTAALEGILSSIRSTSSSPSFGVIVGAAAATAGKEISTFATLTGALVIESGDAKGIVQPVPPAI